MEQLIELLQQIQDLAGTGIDALKEAVGAAGEQSGGGTPPPEAPGGGGQPPSGGGAPPRE